MISRPKTSTAGPTVGSHTNLAGADVCGREASFGNRPGRTGWAGTGTYKKILKWSRFGGDFPEDPEGLPREKEKENAWIWASEMEISLTCNSKIQ